METLFETVVRYFTQEEWYFLKMDSRPTLQMSFNGSNGKWLCYANVNEEKGFFSFYSVCPINVPEERRATVAEFLTRANYGLMIGNFEMDYRDGEVRYKTSLDVENSEINLALIGNLVNVNLLMMDRYLPGILMCIYGNETAEAAIQSIEGEG